MRMRSGGLSKAASERGMKMVLVRQHIQPSGTSATDILWFAVTESYITHISIVEDAASPSTPPPPNGNPGTKKPRVIIVAVRKTGRLRIHKARENANGTFSIGKTWVLEELSAIRSYNGAKATSVEEEQDKQWAGEVGFTVTITKPYFWQANTRKEKDFFITSLVKIFKKYTGGKLPDLIGFDAQEREQLFGITFASRPPPLPLQSGSPGSSYGQPQPRPLRRDPSREGFREPAVRGPSSRDPVQRPQALAQPSMPSSGTSSFTSQTARSQVRTQRGESVNSTESDIVKSQQSQSSLRRLASSNQSQDSLSRSDDGSSLPPRSRSGLNGVPSAAGRFQDRSVTPNSQRAVTPESISNAQDTSNDIPPLPAPLSVPPERRRPPMPTLGDPRQRKQNSAENIVPAPLSSRRDDLKFPARSIERLQSQGLNSSDGSANLDRAAEAETPRNIPSVVDKGEKTPKSTNAPSAVSPQPSMTSPAPRSPEEPEEEVRPGLGPMIKKKSKGDVAGQFLRAAKTVNAFNSFKPRVGGAAERLREAAQKSPEGPDGITGVVPAPSLVRATGNDTSLPTTSSPSDKPSPKKPNDDIPEVKVTIPQSSRPGSVEETRPAPKQDGNLLPEKPKPREVKRIKSPAESMGKELTSIGVNPNILGGRGGELVSAWEEFGWVGQGIRTKNIDQMKDEIDRELNKLQAGGWLNRLEEEDGRIEAIKNGFDRVIDECEELDGLLTLYLVELGVSQSRCHCWVHTDRLDSQ